MSAPVSETFIFGKVLINHVIGHTAKVVKNAPSFSHHAKGTQGAEVSVFPLAQEKNTDQRIRHGAAAWFDPRGRHFAKTITAMVFAGHLAVLGLALGGFHLGPKAVSEPDRVIDVVDIRELVPPKPPKDLPPPPLTQQEAPRLTEKLDAADANSLMPVAADPTPVPAAEPVYLAQSKISEIPLIPTKDILSRIKYPELAAKMGLEATVFLELFIDQTGLIRKISVLKDPGNGFAEAAREALEGVQCRPARDAEGKPVAVRFRYPVRFTLK